MYSRILVPTDGSPLSQHAAHEALALAETLGAQLVALHVVPHYPVSYFEGAQTLSGDEVARTEKAWAEHGQSLVDGFCAIAAERGIPAQGAVVRSDLVADSILSAARKHGCDLIVMASHGRRGLRRVLLGSETQHVLTHSALPVLVIRSTDSKETT